jgi:molecular chaperone GrpE
MENEKDRKSTPESEIMPADEHVLSNPAGVGAGSSSVARNVGDDEQASAQQKLLQERNELYDRLLRKQAELENFRKRMQREKEEFQQHATAELVRALLPTLDGFERALKHRDASVPEQFYRGVELIYKQLSEVLSRAGLGPVETEGRIFDPHLHQAVETVESSEYRDHEIVEELQKGYKLRQRLLRPAIVKVAVPPSRPGVRNPESPATTRGEEGTSEAAEN